MTTSEKRKLPLSIPRVYSLTTSLRSVVVAATTSSPDASRDTTWMLPLTRLVDGAHTKRPRLASGLDPSRAAHVSRSLLRKLTCTPQFSMGSMIM